MRPVDFRLSFDRIGSVRPNPILTTTATMVRFTSKPLNGNSLNRVITRYPALFGVPFILLMVAASYGMTTFTQTRYDLHDQRVKQVLPLTTLWILDL